MQKMTCIYCGEAFDLSEDYPSSTIRCPECQKLLLLPKPTRTEAGSDSFDASQSKQPILSARESPDSIFSEEAEEDDESVLSSVTGPTTSKPILPSIENLHSSFDQPTIRVPGIPDPPRPAAGAIPRPMIVSVPRTAEEGFVVPVAYQPTAPDNLAEVTNPFAAMVTEAEPPDHIAETQLPDSDFQYPNGLWLPHWVVIGLSIYALVMTMIAIWGWSR